MVKGKRKNREESEADQSVKERKVRTAPTNTSLLPPCKVCQEPSAGFHYGANTCEACKGFFRRTLVREGDYKCINGDEKCDVVQATKSRKKRICPRCRHLKCLLVGMSTEAIKTGRYTHSKRAQDILEYKQVMGLSDNSSCSSPCAAVSSTTTAGLVSATVSSSSVKDMFKEQDRSGAGLPSSAALSSAQCSLDKNSPVSAICSLSPPEICENSPEYTIFSPVRHDQPGENMLPGLDQRSSVLSPLSDCYAKFVGYDNNVYPLTSPENSTDFSVSSLVENILDQSLNCGQVHYSESLPESCKDGSMPTPLSNVSSPESSPSSNTGKVSDCMTDEECRSLTSHLLQSFDKFSIFKYEMSATEMLEAQKNCYEKCQAHMEAFGPMGKVSFEEYQAVYETTGIDVDDRQNFFNMIFVMLDKNIRQLISFAKTIPGFCELTMEDQISLIKDNRCETTALFQSQGYNHELKVLTVPTGSAFSEQYLENLCGKKALDSRCHCLRAIQKLGLSSEERVLCGCLLLFTPGRNDLDEPEKVSAIQWKIAQCLMWLLSQNHPHPGTRYSGIISAFLLLKDFSQVFYDWMKSEPFLHYRQFKNYRLVAEWFSNS